MSGEIATFTPSTFEKFITLYKANNILASETLEAFNHFLITLSSFLNILEEFTSNNIYDETITIKWYGSAVISSTDTIRANSNWYRQAVFDNISINMHSDEIGNYITHDGMCFGKVILILIMIILSSTNIIF